jgi:hypothetical protein
MRSFIDIKEKYIAPRPRKCDDRRRCERGRTVSERGANGREAEKLMCAYVREVRVLARQCNISLRYITANERCTSITVCVDIGAVKNGRNAERTRKVGKSEETANDGRTILGVMGVSSKVLLGKCGVGVGDMRWKRRGCAVRVG